MMVPWPLLLLLASSAAARPTEASNDMKARFAAHLTRLRQRHAGVVLLGRGVLICETA